MVMATGIVSIACHLLGLRRSALGLFWLNIVFYAALWALTLRASPGTATRRRRPLHHGRAVGFFTTVAATCVLGTQLLLIVGALACRASVLWFLGIVLWAT